LDIVAGSSDETLLKSRLIISNCDKPVVPGAPFI